jgi:predicted transposase YdaD
MLEVHDIRETRVYQEAQEEGLKKGLEEGLQQGIALAIDIEKMAAKRMSAEEIASILEVDLELVRRVLSARE